METLVQDVRYAFRTLSKNPGFTAVAVLTLALGIGTTSAIFSIVNGVLLRDLPYRDGGEVVVMWGADVDGIFGVSERERVRYREQTQIFGSFGTYFFESRNLTGLDEALRVPVGFIDSDVLPTLGVSPVLGRSFRSEENRNGQNNVALLTHDFWQGRLGANPAVLGETVTLDGFTLNTVGVLPPDFKLPGDFVGQPVQLYVPMVVPDEPDPRNIHYLRAVARLRDGVSLAQANTQLSAFSERLTQEISTLPPTFQAVARPVREVVVGEIRPMLLVLFGAVGLVLLIACVNVANLMLARSDARMREMSIRAAIGAGRARLVRQLITESTVLAILGGSVGLLIAWGATAAVVRFSPPNVPRLDQIGLDLRVVAFTGGVAILTGLFFGIAPALKASRQNSQAVLHEGGRAATVGEARHRLRRLLVVTEIALALMLAIGAGLLVKSFVRLQAVEPGFNAEHVLTMRLTLPSADYRDASAARTFYRDLLERVRAIPGVVNAGAISHLPLANRTGDWGVRIEGREEERLPSGRRPWSDRMVVTENYFNALGIEVLDGRTLSTTDDAGATQVVVINEAMAKAYWPDRSPLGLRFKLSTNIDTLYRTIVGVVANVKHGGLRNESRPEMYLPHSQFPSTDNFPVNSMSLVVRSGGDPLILTSALRRALAALDRNVPVSSVRSMDEVVSASTSTDRLNVVLFGFFGLLGLSLVSVGVYGVMSYWVSQRTRELGIRIALGAAPRTVLGMVVGHGAVLAVIGVAVGIAGALTLGRFLSSLLFGVSSHDVATFLTVPIIVAGVAVLACYVPARRATRVDPIQVLRAE